MVPAAVAAQRHRRGGRQQPDIAWPHAAAQTPSVARHRQAAHARPEHAVRDARRREADDRVHGRHATRRTPRKPNSIVALAQRQLDLRGRARCSSDARRVIPVITRRRRRRRHRARAPARRVVPTGNDIVGLFNSAASRAGGLLDKAHAGHADLYKAHYDALAQLNRAANRTTTRAPTRPRSSAAQFLGTNLAAQLADHARRPDRLRHRRHACAPNARRYRAHADRHREGVQAGPHQLGRPAGACATIRTARSTTRRRSHRPRRASSKIFDGFMTDLGNRTDDITGRSRSPTTSSSRSTATRRRRRSTARLARRHARATRTGSTSTAAAPQDRLVRRHRSQRHDQGLRSADRRGDRVRRRHPGAGRGCRRRLRDHQRRYPARGGLLAHGYLRADRLGNRRSSFERASTLHRLGCDDDDESSAHARIRRTRGTAVRGCGATQARSR